MKYLLEVKYEKHYSIKRQENEKFDNPGLLCYMKLSQTDRDKIHPLVEKYLNQYGYQYEINIDDEEIIFTYFYPYVYGNMSEYKNEFDEIYCAIKTKVKKEVRQMDAVKEYWLSRWKKESHGNPIWVDAKVISEYFSEVSVLQNNNDLVLITL